MTIYFTWRDFDKSVVQIANKCKNIEFSGVYVYSWWFMPCSRNKPQIKNKFNF